MVLNATTVNTDRVKRIQIRPYDQVFALTQYIINSGLETNWKRLCDKDKNLLKPFNAGQDNYVLKLAVLDYPRVVVEAHFAEGLSGVLYYMCFKSGSFVLSTNKYDDNGEMVVDEEGEPVKLKDIQKMDGWKMAFAMQLGMTVDERQSNEFKKIVLKAGEYSLNQLMAKFETAIFKPEQGQYGDKAWHDFSPTIQEGLKYSLNKLKDNLLTRLKGAETISSVLKSTKAPDPSIPKMTFEPNQIQYQTYPWVDPNNMGEFKPSSGFNGNQRLNYMLYCETTGTNQLPGIESRALPRKGNWTDGRLEATANSENTEFGAFHMARENFFDGYLLKKLRFLNRVMEPWGTWNTVRLTDIVNITPSWDSDLGLGNRNDKSQSDSFYDFKIEGDSKWSFHSSVELPEVHDEAGLNGWSGEAWANAKASVTNIIEFVPGSDLIKVTGKTQFEYRYKFVDKHIFKSNDTHAKNLIFDVEWALSLDLEAVDDGGLQILATFDDPQVKMHDESLALQFDAAGRIRGQVENAVRNTKQLKNALANDLADKQGLILPAAGVFFFKNPVLSWRGDLICSVAYSTLQPEKAFDPNDNTKVNEDGKQRASF